MERDQFVITFGSRFAEIFLGLSPLQRLNLVNGGAEVESYACNHVTPLILSSSNPQSRKRSGCFNNVLPC